MKNQKIQSLKYAALICSFPLVVTGCNSGGSTNVPGAAQNNLLQSSQITKSSIPNNKFRDTNVINGNVMHLYQKDLYKNMKLDNFNVSQSVLPSTIGWDSVNNRPASMNCWTYTEQATNSGTSGSVGAAYNAQAAENSLNISGSVSTQFLIFSSSSSFNFSSLTQSSSQSVNAYATAGGTATIQFQVTGLQPFAKQIYDTDPDKFTQMCGDEVVTKLPVQNQIVAGMNFYTNSKSFNQSENAKLSGSYLITSVAADVAAQNATSSTTTSTNINWITMGQYDTNLFNLAQTQIQACLQSNGSSSICSSAFLSMAQAATTAFTNNINTVNTTPNQPLWANYFVVDYSQTANFTFMSDQTALIQAGVPNPVATNPDFKPYKAAIQLNVDVLQDLQTANSILQNNIGPEFNQYLVTASPGNYLIDATSLSEIYTNGLTSTVNAVSGQIQSCLSSTDESSIASNCSALNPSQTVNNAITSYFNAPFSPAINSELASSIAISVDGLIYDSTSSGFATLGGFFLQPVTLSGFIGYTIWVPNNSDGTDVITLPNAKGNNITADGIPLSVGLRSNVYAIFDDPSSTNGQYYPNITTGSNTNVYVGVAGQSSTTGNKIMYSISNNITPAYAGQTCIPFSTSSAGCSYIYILNTGPIIRKKISKRYGINPNNDINIIDNYQIGQANLFKTLYPWAPDNN